MKTTEKISVAILLLFFLMSGLYYAATNSITSDEKTHITVGYINLKFHDYRFNIEHPPFVKQLAALPLLFVKLNFPFEIYRTSVPDDIVKIQNDFLYNRGNDLELLLLLSRAVDIIIAALLGLFIYLYSKRLNGAFAGFISLSLFVLSPLFLGHSSLVTMDTTISCFYFAAIYYLMRYFETEKTGVLIAVAAFTGLSFISKFSGLLLMPVSHFLIFLRGFYPVHAPKKATLKKWMTHAALFLPFLIFAVSYKKSFRLIMPALAVYAISYLFYNKKTIFSKINFVGRSLLIIMTAAFVIVILDYTKYSWFPFHSATMPYFKGFAYFEGHAQYGQDSYLLGVNSKSGGWWYYFPLAIFFKEPFVTLLFFLLGAIGLCMKKEKMLMKVVLIMPAFIYLFIAMFINKLNIGIRHILPVYPFLFVMAGYSVFIVRNSKVMKYPLSALIIILSADVLSSYPAHLSYFNRMVGGFKNGYKYLGDSNIAWGQDWKRLKEYLEKNNINKITIDAVFSCDKVCDYYRIPYTLITNEEVLIPNKGFYVIETTAFPAKRIKWLDKIKPVEWVGGSLLIYNITKDDIDFLKSSHQK
ncbi:MAG: glycosyltransferase family 39 protein [Candidatus Omnitrophota bacterium]|nr:glycosyltransferase family 39 protein [Candidatus Omnitrophota bacterium]